jgi:hypothetical protein
MSVRGERRESEQDDPGFRFFSFFSSPARRF